MRRQNKLELIGIVILTTGGLLFLIEKFLKAEFLSPFMEFREIILYFGFAIWALGLMQKDYLKRKKVNSKSK